MTHTKFFSQNFKMVIKKSTFDAEFESGEKVAKKNFIQAINLEVNDFCCLSSFRANGKTFKPSNFFPVTFSSLFNGFEISVKFCYFFIPISNYYGNFFFLGGGSY
jgi:hypothetical protein